MSIKLNTKLTSPLARFGNTQVFQDQASMEKAYDKVLETYNEGAFSVCGTVFNKSKTAFVTKVRDAVEDNHFLVINGNPRKSFGDNSYSFIYEDILEYNISEDGSQIVIVALADEGFTQFIVNNGVESDEYDKVLGLKFSEDGMSYAYSGFKDGSSEFTQDYEFLFFNGKQVVDISEDFEAEGFTIEEVRNDYVKILLDGAPMHIHFSKSGTIIAQMDGLNDDISELFTKGKGKTFLFKKDIDSLTWKQAYTDGNGKITIEGEEFNKSVIFPDID